MTIENGKVSGKMWFDPELGMIADTSVDQRMTMRMAAPQRPRAPQTNTAGAPMMTTAMNQKISLKLIEVNTSGK
jgi:hypothetical protein